MKKASLLHSSLSTEIGIAVLPAVVVLLISIKILMLKYKYKMLRINKIGVSSSVLIFFDDVDGQIRFVPRCPFV